MDYVCNALGFSFEYLAMNWHLEGRDGLNVILHKMSIYAIALCLIFVLLEMVYESQFIFKLIRIGGMMLQGTWFIHVGLILYGGPNFQWDQNIKQANMVVSIVYLSHILSIFTLICVLSSLIYYKTSKNYGGRNNDNLYTCLEESLLNDSDDE